ncbi:hypothetical protein XELAEV_18046491mg [Xenopus laevis]|uniref:Uncharacterized protein n=1 Tax=Xenopus laevis TaxID=8355 RepID=A0A974BTV0_XENLA|nr:hypothetical protein XELAEV_18046491mg [Xenopus laevis]
MVQKQYIVQEHTVLFTAPAHTPSSPYLTLLNTVGLWKIIRSRIIGSTTVSVLEKITLNIYNVLKLLGLKPSCTFFPFVTSARWRRSPRRGSSLHRQIQDGGAHDLHMVQ